MFIQAYVIVVGLSVLVALLLGTGWIIQSFLNESAENSSRIQPRQRHSIRCSLGHHIWDKASYCHIECSRCLARKERGNAEHIWRELPTGKACTFVTRCTVCGSKLSRYSQPFVRHTVSTWALVPGQCKKQGFCSVCGELVSEYVPHTYEQGACTRCGAKTYTPPDRSK
jgi:hypothetical protein